MLILLPPSEGKTAPKRGRPLDLDALSHPTLREGRARILDALTDLCTDTERARAVLGLTPAQTEQIERNALLRTAPTAAASRVYTGVLFRELDLPNLSGQSLRRANASIAITSGLWGLVRPDDRIPAYRLSGSVSLPGIGPLQNFWRAQMTALAMPRGPILDMRSGIYQKFLPMTAGIARPERVAVVRVFTETTKDGNSVRTVVSHANKATKGQISRALIASPSRPSTVEEVRELLDASGFRVETTVQPMGLYHLDVIV